MKSHRIILSGAIFALVTLGASAARAAPTAADRETARALMDEGDRDIAKADLASALKAYRGADAIMHVPSTGIEVARTEEKLGHLVEAREAALAIQRIPQEGSEPAAFAAARVEAVAIADRLALLIPSIQVRLTGLAPGASVTLTVDGERVPDEAIALPRRANPGAHAIVVAGAGYETVRRDVTLAQKENAVVELTLVPGISDVAPPAPPPVEPVHEAPNHMPAYALFGVSAVGLAVGTVTGIVSLNKVSSAHCTNNVCPAGEQGDVSTAKTFAWTSDVGFGVGIGAAVVGAIFYFTAKSGAPAPSTATTWHFTAGPTGGSGATAGVTGTF